MEKIIIVLVALFSLACCCDKFPNGTDTTLNWFPSCTSPATILGLFASDETNNVEYPIHLGKPLHVHVNLTNNGQVYPDLKLNINIWSWGGWSGCDWHTLPTLGMLSNLDACQYGLPCPVPKGNQLMTLVIDFSKFQGVIDLLQDDAPYQVQMVMTAANGDTVCVTVQARCRIH